MNDTTNNDTPNEQSLNQDSLFGGNDSQSAGDNQTDSQGIGAESTELALINADVKPKRKPRSPRASSATKPTVSRARTAKKKNAFFNYADEFKTHFLVLFSLIALSRILAAIFIPNAVWDSFEYIEKINFIRTELQNGTFNLGDMFGLWVPFYQFFCAFIEFVFSTSGGGTIFVPKLITAIFGITASLLIVKITLDITKNEWSGLIAGACVLIHPTLLVYSSTALTDIPYSAIILAMLIALMNKRWYLASFFIAIASLTRTDGWVLIPLVTMLVYYLQTEAQLKVEAALAKKPDQAKEVPRGFYTAIICFAIMFSGIILWFMISKDYGGNILYFFKYRNEYIEKRSAYFASTLAITPKNIVKNFNSLFISLYPYLIVIVIAAIYNSFSAKWNIKSILTYVKNERKSVIFLPSLIFGYMALYYIGVYFARQQNEFFVRYGITMLSIAIPISIYLLNRFISMSKFAYGLVAIVSIVGVWTYVSIIKEEMNFRWSMPWNDKVSNFITKYANENPNSIIYCDNPIVRVNSKLPASRFIMSSQLNADFNHANVNIDSIVVAKKIGLAILTNYENCTLIRKKPILKEGKSNSIYRYEDIMPKGVQDYYIVYVYSIQPELLRPTKPEKTTKQAKINSAKL